MFLNFFINFRLGEGRLILFIVTVPSIAYNIDEDIFVKLLSVGDCDFHALIEDVGDISVDVDDWGIDCFGHFGAVEGRTTLFGDCCKTDLVIVDDMDNTSWTVVN